MTVVSRVHRANQADVVRDLLNVRKQFRKLGPRFSATRELPGAAQQLLAGSIDETVNHVSGIILSVKTLEFRFRICQIHVRWATVHKQRNHRFRGTGKVSIPGMQIERRRLLNGFRRIRPEFILLHQIGQGQAANSHGVLFEKSTPCTKWEIHDNFSVGLVDAQACAMGTGAGFCNAGCQSTYRNSLLLRSC